jgi:hypothetical protein
MQLAFKVLTPPATFICAVMRAVRGPTRTSVAAALEALLEVQ